MRTNTDTSTLSSVALYAFLMQCLGKEKYAAVPWYFLMRTYPFLVALGFWKGKKNYFRCVGDLWHGTESPKLSILVDRVTHLQKYRVKSKSKSKFTWTWTEKWLATNTVRTDLIEIYHVTMNFLNNDLDVQKSNAWMSGLGKYDWRVAVEFWSISVKLIIFARHLKRNGFFFTMWEVHWSCFKG